MIHFDLPAKKQAINELTAESESENFWNDARHAQSIINKLNALKDVVSAYEKLDAAFASMEETAAILKSEMDAELFELFEEEYHEAEDAFEKFEMKVLLSHEYDHSSAILELHPGAGGTESQDWAEMLYRMYSRWAQSKGYKCTVLDYLDGEEAGLKSVSLLIEGDLAYGYLKAEKGVHRLVRISPFDSSGRRHTSFASIDVIPELDDTIEIDIKPEDLRIDTYRASGAGGQHINKTDSAVRITHIPTGTVVTCQSQRSQIQNREQAMMMLKSKLFALMEEKQAKELKEIQGEQKEIAWGSQIRSYVLHPYSLVKDNRSLYESNNPKDVLDGNLDDFIYAYLKSRIQEGGHEE